MSGPTATLSFEFSRNGLLELRERIDDLLESFGPDEDEPSAEERARRKVGELWPRLKTGNSRRYLEACAARGDGWFTIEDVASDLGETAATTKAFHRNVARSAAVSEPRTTSLFETRREKKRTTLHMPAEIRDAIKHVTHQSNEPKDAR